MKPIKPGGKLLTPDETARLQMICSVDRDIATAIIAEHIKSAAGARGRHILSGYGGPRDWYKRAKR